MQFAYILFYFPLPGEGGGGGGWGWGWGDMHVYYMYAIHVYCIRIVSISFEGCVLYAHNIHVYYTYLFMVVHVYFSFRVVYYTAYPFKVCMHICYFPVEAEPPYSLLLSRFIGSLHIEAIERCLLIVRGSAMLG